MKWLYICIVIIGLLAPIAVIYVVNYDRRIPGTIVDLGLLFFSAGVGVLFIPIGVGAGLGLVVVIQFVWKKISARPDRTRSMLQQHPPESEALQDISASKGS